VHPTSSETFDIVNMKSGKCVALAGGKSSKGARAVQRTCTDSSDQHWTLARLGNTFSIVGGNGLCLEVRDQSREEGAAVQLAECTHASNQLWTIDSHRADDFERLYQADKDLLKWQSAPTAEFPVVVTVDDRRAICRSDTPEHWIGLVDGPMCVGKTYDGSPTGSQHFQVLYQAP